MRRDFAEKSEERTHPHKPRVGHPTEKERSIHREENYLEHLAEDILEDAAVMIVGDFFGSVDAGGGGELLGFAVFGFGADGDRFSGGE